MRGAGFTNYYSSGGILVLMLIYFGLYYGLIISTYFIKRNKLIFIILLLANVVFIAGAAIKYGIFKPRQDAFLNQMSFGGEIISCIIGIGFIAHSYPYPNVNGINISKKLSLGGLIGMSFFLAVFFIAMLGDGPGLPDAVFIIAGYFIYAYSLYSLSGGKIGAYRILGTVSAVLFLILIILGGIPLDLTDIVFIVSIIFEALVFIGCAIGTVIYYYGKHKRAKIAGNSADEK
jgi:hypothetical protein